MPEPRPARDGPRREPRPRPGAQRDRQRRHHRGRYGTRRRLHDQLLVGAGLLASADHRAAGRSPAAWVAELRPGPTPPARCAAPRVNPTRLLPPGVTPYPHRGHAAPARGVLVVNTQLTQRLLSPLENAFGGALGLTDLELTLDYGGRVGYTARQQLSRKHAVYATRRSGPQLPDAHASRLRIASRPGHDDQLHVLPAKRDAVLHNSIFGNTSTVVVQQRHPAARPTGKASASSSGGRTSEVDARYAQGHPS